MTNENQDIADSNCLDSTGALVVGEQNIKDIWKQFMAKLMNEGNINFVIMIHSER